MPQDGLDAGTIMSNEDAIILLLAVIVFAIAVFMIVPELHKAG